MHNSQRVYVSYPNDDLLQDVAGFDLLKVLEFFDKTEQILPLHQLCYDVNVSFGHDGLLEKHQQWVRHHRHDPTFVAALGKNVRDYSSGGVIQLVRFDNLYGVALVGGFFYTMIDD